MTHTQMYKRDVNPQFGLLFNGREECERETNTEGGEKTQEEKDTSC